MRDVNELAHDQRTRECREQRVAVLVEAIGLDGLGQKLLGILSADIIVAINKDPDSPIFEIADYGIVGDLYKVIPEIIEMWDQADSLVDSDSACKVG